jgi:hypothetical protein
MDAPLPHPSGPSGGLKGLPRLAHVMATPFAVRHVRSLSYVEWQHLQYRVLCLKPTNVQVPRDMRVHFGTRAWPGVRSRVR